MPCRITTIAALVVFALSVAGDLPRSTAGSELRCASMEDAMERIAESVCKGLNDNDKVWVHSVGKVDGLGKGNELQLFLKDAIEQISKRKCVQNGANVRIECVLKKHMRDGTKDIIGLKIYAYSWNPGDIKKIILELSVRSRDEGIAVAAETGEILPSPILAAPKPKAEPEVLGGTRLYPRPGCPYSVEILVKSSDGPYEPRKIGIGKDGLPKVELKRGELYGVRVYNDTDFEAGVTLKIDGLSRFALSDDKKKYRNSFDLVLKGVPRDLEGYHRDDKKVYKFLVGSFENSIAKKYLSNPDNGDIMVMFRAAWKKGTPKPEDEKDDVPIASIGTEPGPQGADRTSDALRIRGDIRAVIRIRYGEY